MFKFYSLVVVDGVEVVLGAETIRDNFTLTLYYIYILKISVVSLGF